MAGDRLSALLDAMSTPRRALGDTGERFASRCGSPACGYGSLLVRDPSEGLLSGGSVRVWHACRPATHAAACGKGSPATGAKAGGMKLERLNDLQLEVADVDRSARWYRRMLGLRIVAQGLPETCILQSVEGFRLRLVSGTPLRARQFRLGVHLDDRVAVRRWRAHVDASGGFGNPVTESAGYYGCTVADPDGYLVEFYTEAPEV